MFRSGTKRMTRTTIPAVTAVRSSCELRGCYPFLQEWQAPRPTSGVPVSSKPTL